MTNKMEGSAYYGYTCRCGTVVKKDKDHKYTFRSSNSLFSTIVPPKYSSYKNALLHTTKEMILEADTGATGNYIRKKDGFILEKLQSTHTGPVVRLPNGQLIRPDQKGHFPYQLPTYQILPQNPTLFKISTVPHSYPLDNCVIWVSQLCSLNRTLKFLTTIRNWSSLAKEIILTASGMSNCHHCNPLFTHHHPEATTTPQRSCHLEIRQTKKYPC